MQTIERSGRSAVSSSRSIAYSPLHGDDNDECETQGSAGSLSGGPQLQRSERASRQRLRQAMSILQGVVLVTLFTTFIVGLITIDVRFVDPLPNTSAERYNISYTMKAPCGGTPEEARARGCRFDVASFCWLPEQCFDAEVAQAFDEHGWNLYFDENKTQPLSHEEVLSGEHSWVYAEWEFHITHCTAMWTKMHKALLTHGPAAIDSYLGSLDHTAHCNRMVLMDRETAMGEINTVLLIKYPDCGMKL